MSVPSSTGISVVFYALYVIFSVCATAGNVNVFPDVESIDNETAVRPDYQTDSSNVILKPGRYKLKPDGTVVIQPLKTMQDDLIYEFWSNSSLFCDYREKGRNLCGVRWSLSVTSHAISYTTILLTLFLMGIFDDPVKTSFYGTLLCNGAIFFTHFIVLIVNVLEGIPCEPFGKTLDVYTHLFLLASAFWMSSIAVDSLSNFRHLYGGFAEGMPLRGNLPILASTLFARLLIMEISSTFYDIMAIPESQLWLSVKECAVPYIALYRFYMPIVVIYGIGNLCNCVLFALSFFCFRQRATGVDRRLLIFLFLVSFGFSLFLTFIWNISTTTAWCVVSQSFYTIYSMKTVGIVMFLMIVNIRVLFAWVFRPIELGV